jgi:hypothetical protein
MRCRILLKKDVPDMWGFEGGNWVSGVVARDWAGEIRRERSRDIYYPRCS